MAKKNFVHLHVHTKYSIGDGIADIMDLISAAKNAGMDAVAITDDCVMNGVAEFYCEAISRGIKPIIGCEVYVAEEPLKGDNTNAKNESHLVLLAENRFHNSIMNLWNSIFAKAMSPCANYMMVLFASVGRRMACCIVT